MMPSLHRDSCSWRVPAGLCQDLYSHCPSAWQDKSVAYTCIYATISKHKLSLWGVTCCISEWKGKSPDSLIYQFLKLQSVEWPYFGLKSFIQESWKLMTAYSFHCLRHSGFSWKNGAVHDSVIMWFLVLPACGLLFSKNPRSLQRHGNKLQIYLFIANCKSEMTLGYSCLGSVCSRCLERHSPAGGVPGPAGWCCMCNVICCFRG